MRGNSITFKLNDYCRLLTLPYIISLYNITLSNQATGNEMKVGNGWNIELNKKPIPDRMFDYDFWHDDHDGDNGLSGSAASFDDAVQEILRIEEIDND